MYSKHAIISQIWSTKTLIDPIMKCGSVIFEMDGSSATPLDETVIKLEDEANAWVMCVANLVVGNSAARHALWKYLERQKIV